VSGLVDDLPSRWAGQRVLLIGHLATRWALETVVNGATLEQLAREQFRWREGWEYHVEDG
jgi:2,3-bisphosphoglycerate-dependent phosphoglycerate mutase